MNCTIQFATDFYAGAAEYVRDHPRAKSAANSIGWGRAK
jgi:hypothetical protein